MEIHENPLSKEPGFIMPKNRLAARAIRSLKSYGAELAAASVLSVTRFNPHPARVGGDQVQPHASYLRGPLSSPKQPYLSKTQAKRAARELKRHR